MSNLIEVEVATRRQLVEIAILSDDFELAVSVVEEAIINNKWLRLAFLSYYRRGTKLSLYDVGLLDWDNIEYFRLICNLRKMSGWTDDRLYELELLAKSV